MFYVYLSLKIRKFSLNISLSGHLKYNQLFENYYETLIMKRLKIKMAVINFFFE